jgi:hypothetical protein
VIEFIQFAGSLNGDATGFNNLGQVAFLAEFTDGSEGVFVSNVVSVPEPSTHTVALIVFSLLLIQSLPPLRG